MDQETIYTIGHSTRSSTEFIAILQDAGVDKLVDVRTITRSRANPQFNADALDQALSEAGIAYVHLPALGGLRHRPKGAEPSRNMLWRNASFRNYADYAETQAFRDGLDALREICGDCVCAIMCAEAVWWRCHRRIVADYLLAAGIRVVHLMGHNKSEIATMTPGAKVLPDGSIRYAAPPDKAGQSAS